GTSRKDLDQGPIQRKETGRPRYAAASTRMVRPGRSGCGPSQAVRESAYTGGLHRGSTERKALGSRPAARDSAGRAAAGAGPDALSISCGTPRSSFNRPSESSRTSFIPARIGGGSDSVTRGEGKGPPVKAIGTRGSGLSRYSYVRPSREMPRR